MPITHATVASDPQSPLLTDTDWNAAHTVSIENADVAANAAIAATKIANGSVSDAEFQYLDGVTSAIQTQLDGKVDENAPITGATKTKVTYDAKGLVTSGADATTADIAASTNKNYVTDAQLTVIGNTSGTNTGDQKLVESTGIITGGALSIGTGGAGVATTFTIAAGTGQIVDSTVSPPTITSISWSQKTDVAVTNILTQLVTFVAIDSGGNVIQSATDFTPQQYREYISIGVVVHSNQTTVNAINQAQTVAYAPISQLNDLYYGLGLFNISGNVFSTNGANLKLNKSAGSLFRRGSNYSSLSTNPHVIATGALTQASLRMQNQTGAGSASGTDVDVANYDVGGVTTAISPATRFSILRVFLFQSNLVAVQRGQATYLSLAEAKAAIQTEVFVTNSVLVANGLLRGFIVAQASATSLSDAAKVFFIDAGKFGGSAGVGGLSVSTLQNAYNNSSSPEIVTDATLLGVTIRRGSGADTDVVLEAQNGAGSTTFSVTGEGTVTGLSLKANSSSGVLIESANGTDIGNLGAANTANVTWYGSHNYDTATASTIASFGASKTLESLSTSTYPSLAELSYVKGVTSAIQTQLGNKAASGANTDITSVYLSNTGLKIKDTNASHGLIISPGSDLTADHTLTITTGDADRALIISGSTTLGGGSHSGTNTGDQTSIVGITGTIAQFNTACTDADFVTLAGSETLTNKTLTSPILTTPTLGTPASGTLTSCTGLPVGGISATGTPSAANFLRGDGSWSSPSGSGDVVGPASATDNAIARFDSTTGKLIQNSAATIADTTGDITAGKYNGLTVTASTGTLTVANAKTLTANNTITLAGTDSTTMTFPTTSATLARTDAANTFTGTQTIGALVATTVNGNTFSTGTGVLTIAAAKTLTASNTLTLAGTDSTVMTFPTTSATIARTDAANTFTGTQTIGALLATTTVLNHTAQLATGGLTTTFQQFGTTAATGARVLGMFNATAGTQAEFQFYRSKNAAIGSADVVASGDGLGRISWYGAQQTGTFATQTKAAEIRAEVDGTVTSGAGGDMPGRLVFSTTADAGSAVTDRLILDAAGVLKPNANDGVALGTTALSFSDLFLASGAVLNIANSNWIATHSSGILTVGTGDLRVTTAGTNTASCVTVGGTQTLTAKTLTTPVIDGLATGTGVASASTVSTIATRDSNGNLFSNSTRQAVTVTATASGTTTLTVASTYHQTFSGSLAQTVVLPQANATASGQAFFIKNLSTGVLTIQDAAFATQLTMPASTAAYFYTINQTTWDKVYYGEVITTAKSLTVSNSLTLAGTDATTMTFPSTSGTVVTLDATQTLTNKTLTAPAIGAATATSINFGGTSLANYVQGSWTPTLIGSTTPGAQTYGTQTGTYTRIGNQVFCEARVSITAKDAAIAGNVQIGGLPITIGSTASNGSTAALATGFTLTAAGYWVYAAVASGGTTMNVRQCNGNADAAITVANMAAASEIRIQFSYTV